MEPLSIAPQSLESKRILLGLLVDYYTVTAAVTRSPTKINTILIQPGQCVFRASGPEQYIWLCKLQLLVVIFANSGLLLLQGLSSSVNISVWDSSA